MKRKEKKSRSIWNVLSFCFGILFFLLVWWVVSVALKANGSGILKDPFATIGRLSELLFLDGSKQTWNAIGWTIARLLIGLAASFLLAGFLGTLAGLFRPVRAFLIPAVGFARTIPTAAVVLVLSVVFLVPGRLGFADFIPAVLTFLVAFPLFYEAFVSGITALDQDTEQALTLDAGTHSLRAVCEVLWPMSLPQIKMAGAQGLGLSLKVTIMSEVLTANSATHPGLGSLITDCQTNPSLKVEDIIPYSLLAFILMLFLDIPLFLTRIISSKEAE